MTTPASAAAGQDFQELLDRAASLLERIGNKLRELVDKINRMLSMTPAALVPDWIVTRLQVEIPKMNELWRKVSVEVVNYFTSPGWPPALYDAGDRWLDDVAGPSADTEAQVNTNHMKVDDYWKGSAAAKYKETLGAQQSAFAAMTDVARKIKDLLHQAARGIRNFWVAVVFALAGVAIAVIGLVGGIVTAWTGVGAVIGVIALILGLIMAIGAGAWAIFIEFESIKLAAEAMKEEAEYNTSFDGDKWPKATAEGQWKAD